MSQFILASAFNSLSLTAPPQPYPPYHPNDTKTQVNNVIRSPSKHTERSGSLSSFLCHVLYLEHKLRDEEGLGGFIDDNVERVSSRAKLGEGSQFIVYSAQASFKRPMGPIKAHDPAQLVAVKVVKTFVDEA
jgi:hypothetical protein